MYIYSSALYDLLWVSSDSFPSLLSSWSFSILTDYKSASSRKWIGNNIRFVAAVGKFGPSFRGHVQCWFNQLLNSYHDVMWKQNTNLAHFPATATKRDKFLYFCEKLMKKILAGRGKQLVWRYQTLLLASKRTRTHFARLARYFLSKTVPKNG